MRRGNQTTTTVSTTDVVVLSANWHRKGILVSNSGPGGIMLSAGSPATATQGILIQPNVVPLEIHTSEWGTWPGMELHAIGVALAGTGGGQTFVQKTVYGHNVPATGTGVVLLSYTCPANKIGLFVMAIAQATSGSPTTGMHVTPNGGASQDLGGIMVGGAYSPFYLYMFPGDKVELQVVAGAGGNTIDCALSIQEWSTAGTSGGGTGGTLTVWAVED
jgi:hypothetical protein